MSPVTFNEPSYEYKSSSAPKGKGISGWIIAHGFAKDERGANIFMLSAAGIGFAVIVVIWMSTPRVHPPTPAETARIQASTQQPAPQSR